MNMTRGRYDVLIIGGGLSGLTAAALLAKRGLSVAVVDRNDHPGGSCGIFKRGETTFDIGAAMLYGFGAAGFNAHRFVFNCLEEPIDVIRHDYLYCVHYGGDTIYFSNDVAAFADELARLFPHEKQNIRRFYRDMTKMYRHVMVETPNYTTPDETAPLPALKGFLRHPISYMRFLSYLNKSADQLLKQYFSDPALFRFFDKMTSTYCYATVAEAPAILAAVMFVDNHVGGSYYPAGSTVFLPGRLEKVIEAHGGDMIMRREVRAIRFEGGEPTGVELDDGSIVEAKRLVYSGTVWNLYGRLIPHEESSSERREWAAAQIPTYPSVVLYATVDRSVIPDGTLPIEMVTGNPKALDESEITVYCLSIDDRTLCAEDEHTVIAIGPSFGAWPARNTVAYAERKEEEKARLFAVLERRFPGFSEAVRHVELATPQTIERYVLKNGGAVAGPKQMLGQHMFRRLRTRTEWKRLYCCGESTVMGTGTPTVTTEGLSAANAILKDLGQPIYRYREGMRDYVRTVAKPFTPDRLYEHNPAEERAIMMAARRCRLCEQPTCVRRDKCDIPGVMRRVTVGNFYGARRCLNESEIESDAFSNAERHCVRALEGGEAVELTRILTFLKEQNA